MQTAELTIPAPSARPRRVRIAAIVTAVAAIVLAAAGTLALGANAWRVGDGYFTWSTETFTSSGYAIAMKSVDISHAPRWAFGDAGLDSVRIEAESDRPLFIGIARASDLDRYLRGTEHDEVSGLSYRPFQVAYEHVEGHAPRRAPVDEPIWVAATSGPGSLALSWKPEPGDWRAVVMNADGTRGVTAELQLGARTQLAWWLGGALLGAAALAAGGAAALFRRARIRSPMSSAGSIRLT
jgi:hypothetical protein